jgi:DNA-binding response OmpR family regulator
VTSPIHRRPPGTIRRTTASPASDQQPGRILVVDDNVDAAESLALLLKLHGYETQVAHDGMDAVAAAPLFRADVILLDIGMPRVNGYDVARLMREQAWSKDVVIIALTGWGRDEDRRQSADAGIDHHLVKPVNVEALLELVASATRVGRGD